MTDHNQTIQKAAKFDVSAMKELTDMLQLINLAYQSQRA